MPSPRPVARQKGNMTSTTQLACIVDLPLRGGGASTYPKLALRRHAPAIVCPQPVLLLCTSWSESPVQFSDSSSFTGEESGQELEAPPSDESPDLAPCLSESLGGRSVEEHGMSNCVL
ncbi:hypothetical protein BV25DRAFT_1362320 [Artomyces pyxidatus]|uniref:Uncharacterized protein n=1 Tax=Artomyces pyxidatus TaxID=48021 RepID=A0ACB8SNL4_9AGAM|nr:hypothetical protein BV25DRAFT_1362320 [Artomyces pyxidatus]